MPALRVFDGEDTWVPEGSSHEYECTFKEASGAAIQLAAIGTITGWLDDVATGGTINSRDAVPLKGASGGTLVDGGAGVGKFTWALDAADAVMVGTKESEFHRITLKVTYTRTGGGTAQLTHSVLYRVVALARI